MLKLDDQVGPWGTIDGGSHYCPLHPTFVKQRGVRFDKVHIISAWLHRT